MRRAVRGVPLLLLAASACAVRSPAPPVPEPRYVVGAAYEAGGAWFYPREDLHYEATGLATVLAGRSGLTANGEVLDPAAMQAAHPTLQLPAIARVTALDTGRQVLVRVNDRGPADPGRLIALSPRAAELLGLQWGVAARVRVEVDPAASEQLREALGGGPRLAMDAAPRAAVGRESLAPPPGVSASGRRHAGSGPAPASAAAEPSAPTVPWRLPETVLEVAPAPGQLWVRAGEFGRAEYANVRRAQLASLPVQVERNVVGRSETFRVRAGPFATVPDADSALDQARRAGVGDARITVE